MGKKERISVSELKWPSLQFNCLSSFETEQFLILFYFWGQCPQTVVQCHCTGPFCQEAMAANTPSQALALALRSSSDGKSSGSGLPAPCFFPCLHSFIRSFIHAASTCLSPPHKHLLLAVLRAKMQSQRKGRSLLALMTSIRKGGERREWWVLWQGWDRVLWRLGGHTSPWIWRAITVIPSTSFSRQKKSEALPTSSYPEMNF